MSNFNLLKKLEKELNSKVDLPLKETSKNLVFGKGNPQAKIIFVGEAAGRKEDEQGLPFVGAAGKNLDKLLASVKLSLEDVYITNILKYRPPENRNPTPNEIQAHTPWLLKQINIIRPKVICSLGNYSTKFFLAKGVIGEMTKQPGITSLHGSVKKIVFQGLNINLIPLFHPAAIIYNRKLRPLWEADMSVVKKEISKIS
jgi:uracil-DNA glycosylase